MYNVQYSGALAACNVTRCGTPALESKLLHMHQTPSFHMPTSPHLPSPHLTSTRTSALPHLSSPNRFPGPRPRRPM